MLDWKLLPEGREKYQAYLCSPEWGARRAAVERRSKGMCERGCGNRADAVHHLTYIRKFDEPIEDLIHLCQACHDFQHGRRDRDPVLAAPVTLRGTLIESVYLAGKITGTAWRDEILPNWSSSCEVSQNDEAAWQTVLDCVPLPDGRTLDYAGPYWRDIYGGHSWHDMRGHPHAYVTASAGRSDLKIEIMFALLRANLLFAWIDSPDCYGTIAEISYRRGWSAGLSAIGEQKTAEIIIVIASPRPMQDLWLAHSMADITILATTPAEAWKQLWRGTWISLKSGYQSGDANDDVSEHGAPIQAAQNAPTPSTIWQNGSLRADTGPLTGIETIEGLEAAIEEFDGCSLKRTATNTVFADGNPAAPVMMIGEAPGAREDEAGLPFVGQAGELLDEWLATIGLDRDRVRLTNIVFWRLPGSRTPTASEIGSCLPLVLRHIALVMPKVLVLLGGTAAGALLPSGQGITRLRGRWFDLIVPGLDRPVHTMPMFHPSFILRTPEQQQKVDLDLQALRERLKATY
jgi:uracil-DNA glycosylase family 4